MSDNKAYDVIIDVDEKKAIKSVNKFEKSFTRSMNRADKIAKGLGNDKLTSNNDKKIVKNLDSAIFKKAGYMAGQTFYESLLDSINSEKIADKTLDAFEGNKILKNMFSKKDLYIKPIIEFEKIKSNSLEEKRNKLSKDIPSKRDFYVSPIIKLAKTGGSFLKGKENKLSENAFDKGKHINFSTKLSKTTDSSIEIKKNKLSEDTFNISPFVKFADKIKSINGNLKEINTAYKDIKTNNVTDRSIFKNKKWFIKINNSKAMEKVTEKVSKGYSKIKGSKAGDIFSKGYNKIKGSKPVAIVSKGYDKIKDSKSVGKMMDGIGKVKSARTNIAGKIPELASKIKDSKAGKIVSAGFSKVKDSKTVSKLSKGFNKFKDSKLFGKVSKGFNKISGPLNLAVSAANIATSDDKVKTSAEEAGSMAGAAIGGKAGAAIGSAIVPVVGTAIGGAVGSIAGGFIGKKLAGLGVNLFRKRKEKDEESKNKVKSYETVDSKYIRAGSGGLGTVNVNGVTLNMNTNELDEENLIYKIGRAVYEAMENKAVYQIC